jgi:hypothetical protein
MIPLLLKAETIDVLSLNFSSFLKDEYHAIGVGRWLVFNQPPLFFHSALIASTNGRQ